MMRLFILAAVLLSPSLISAHTLLAVFAHPDDETTVGGALAKYAAQGHDVYLVTITSGQAGNANTDIPKGEKLGAAREEEDRCACRALGIHEPVLLGFQDGAMADPGAMRRIGARLLEVVKRIKPDVIVTWGPDGLTGHPDHRVASNLISQIFQQRSRLERPPRKLYYVAWPESRFRNAPADLRAFASWGLVADEFVTTEIDVSDQAEKAWKSLQCHKTQWSPQRMEQNRSLQTEILDQKVYLRLALSDSPLPGEKETDVFAGVR